jgi:hypothetical protein
METFSDLNTFARILTDKGYNGYFQTQGAYGGKLKDSISEYIASCQKSEDCLPKQDLLLTGYLQWLGDDKPRIVCIMWVKYLNGEFSLSKMEIAKKDGFGQLVKKTEMTDLSATSVPTVREAVTLVNDEPKQQVDQSRKRFKL